MTRYASAPGGTMIQGIRDIYYNVQDMQRAVRFYTEVLGMRETYGHEHWVSLDCGGAQVGLHWTGGESVPLIPRDSHGTHSGATLTLRSNDVPADRKKIEAGGGKILGEADQAWGHMLVFEDLDGNVLKLMNPKY